MLGVRTFAKHKHLFIYIRPSNVGRMQLFYATVSLLLRLAISIY